MKQQYVIKSEDGYYVGIDTASGGYPFETENINSAYIFLDKQKALEYKNKFPKEKWHLFSVEIIPLLKRERW